MNSDHRRWVGHRFVTLGQDLHLGHINHGVNKAIDTYTQDKANQDVHLTRIANMPSKILWYTRHLEYSARTMCYDIL